MILFIYIPLLFEMPRIIFCIFEQITLIYLFRSLLQFVVEIVWFFHKWYKLIPLLFTICCKFVATSLVNLSFRFIYLAPFFENQYRNQKPDTKYNSIKLPRNEYQLQSLKINTKQYKLVRTNKPTDPVNPINNNLASYQGTI